MNSTVKHDSRRTKNIRTKKAVGISALSCAALLGMLSISVAPAALAASEPSVGLGSASTFSVLGGQTVTNTGATVLANDLGVSPGTSITGFPPGVTLGTVHAADANASLAQNDLTTAYNDAAGRAPTQLVSGDLVGQTLVGGVYKSASTLDLNGTVTLDAQGDPSSVWIFQVGSALTTGSASNVTLVNGASACNVYWQVGSSATLGTNSTFKGSILALTSISVTTDAAIEGRALARNGAVTLDNNVISDPVCPAAIPTPTPSASPSPSVTPTPSASATPSASSSATPVPSSSTSAPVVVPSPSSSGGVVSPAPDSSSDSAVIDVPSESGLTSELESGDAALTEDTSGASGTESDASLVSDEELAETGANNIPLITSLAVVLALFGGALLMVSSRTARIARRH